MWNLICRNLADLASVRIQHRFIGNATKEEYILPDELLECAANAVRLAQTSTTLNAKHRDAVLKFANTLETARPNFNRADFYNTDSQWIDLRMAAADCLQSLGFDLQKYESGMLDTDN